MAKFMRMLILVFLPFIFFTACGGEDTQFDPEAWHLSEVAEVEWPTQDMGTVDISGDTDGVEEVDMKLDPGLIEMEVEQQPYVSLLGDERDYKISMKTTDGCVVSGFAIRLGPDRVEELKSSIESVQITEIASTFQWSGDNKIDLTFAKPIEAQGEFNLKFYLYPYGDGYPGREFTYATFDVLPISEGCEVEASSSSQMTAQSVEAHMGGIESQISLSNSQNSIATLYLDSNAGRNTSRFTPDLFGASFKEACFKLESDGINYRRIFLVHGENLEIGSLDLELDSNPGKVCVPMNIVVPDDMLTDIDLRVDVELTPSETTFIRVWHVSYTFSSSDPDSDTYTYYTGSGEGRLIAYCDNGCQ